MNKVLLYSRVSTDKQLNGLASQRLALETYCKNKGISNYEIFEDFAYSGSLKSRPQLDLLLKEVRSGTVSTVIVYSFSRFARSTKFLLDTLDLFGGLGIQFISLTENIDTATPIGKMMFSVIAALATLEKDLVSQRVTNGMIAARARGSKIGRPQTVQYDLVVTLRNEGYTYKQISDMLSISEGSVTRALKKLAHKLRNTNP